MAEVEIRNKAGKLLGRLNDLTGAEEITEEWQRQLDAGKKKAAPPATAQEKDPDGQ